MASKRAVEHDIGCFLHPGSAAAGSRTITGAGLFPGIQQNRCARNLFASFWGLNSRFSRDICRQHSQRLCDVDFSDDLRGYFDNAAFASNATVHAGHVLRHQRLDFVCR